MTSLEACVRESKARISAAASGERFASAFTPTAAFVILVACAIPILTLEARAQLQSTVGTQSVLQSLIKWFPLILFGPPREFGGFALNIAVSFLAMALGTAVGIVLGLGQISIHRPLRNLAWALTQFFRNAPWLVLLFFVMLLTPFQIRLFGFSIPLPGWLKASVGLSLPIMANMSEIVRGAVNSIPTAQWESAESLAFTRLQTLWRIILPQCVRRMIPPWMNWYAILTMATPLISIVGVNDAMTLTQDALSAEQRTDLLMPMYSLLLALFFLYCYPIARWTLWLERKYAVKI
ncbi:MAG: amino acid ABC transporter permease [Hyphomicrobiales bacterium]|nr:MAG: amino acid ABC transporter permease [Hyphomicrobiales bacterium]